MSGGPRVSEHRPELVGDVLAAVATVPQGHRWGLRLAPQQRLMPVILLTALLLSALIGFALIAGTRDTTPPSGDGLIAYESGGDIYVGDPTTGATTAVVTGPDVEGDPIFSPDGSRIAFYRSPTGARGRRRVADRREPRRGARGRLGRTSHRAGTFPRRVARVPRTRARLVLMDARQHLHPRQPRRRKRSHRWVRLLVRRIRRCRTQRY